VQVEGWLALPQTVQSLPAQTGTGVIVLASVLFLLLPWERWPGWTLISIALIDILGVALLRLAYFSDLPSVGVLTLFPVVWLSYAFRRWAISLALLGALFITLLPSFVSGSYPSTPLGYASILTLPVLVSGLAIAVGEAGRQLAGAQTKVRRANAQLRESLRHARDSDALNRAMFAAVNVAMAFYDTNGKLVFANDGAYEAAAAAGFSLESEPHAGVEVRAVSTGKTIPFDDQIIPRALRGDLDAHEREWIGPVGSQIAIVASSQRISRADGTPWGTLIVAYDVTALERSLQVKEEFIATVSHELRTPLTSVIGYLELLSEEIDMDNDSINETMKTITRNTTKLHDRIKQLLETAEERRTMNLRSTDLTDIAGRALDSVAESARSAGITLERRLLADEWASVDAPKIEQVIENLLSNAVKFTPRDGTITLELSSDERSVTITISDTGIGMTPDDTAQAFETFWRAETSRKKAIPGLGIGLSLVRRIVEAHHGSITVASTPGDGTTFTIVLPRTQ